MAIQSVVLPQLGESVAEATLSKWLVNKGDRVERDQTLAEVSTDKADIELPSPFAGRVARRLVAEGQPVPVNAPILELETETAAAAPAPQPAGAPPAPAPAPSPAEAPAGRAREEPRSSPLVRRIAREKGVDLAEISGTGAGGRVTKGDILAYLSRRPSGPGAPPPPLRAPPPHRPSARPPRPGSCARPRRPRRPLPAPNTSFRSTGRSPAMRSSTSAGAARSSPSTWPTASASLPTSRAWPRWRCIGPRAPEGAPRSGARR